MFKKEKFKLQFDLMGTSILIYNKDRSQTGVINGPAAKELAAELDIEPMSVKYCEGFVDSDGLLNTDMSDVTDEGW